MTQRLPEATEAAFLRAHPRYATTAALDELRRSDFARLEAGGHVYLDYTGAGVYADSQLGEHPELLRANVFGNPHSLDPTSSAMTELTERAREEVLEFFGASLEEYVAIFTPNATGALRLVGEAYPFHPGDRFLLTFDNRNSVNGIREFARARGAETTYVPSEACNLRVDEQLLRRYLTEVGGEHHNLFAYPAQSNFSGVQHPFAWIKQAHVHGWDVLVDAAAYVPTNRLDLGRWQPDFPLSVEWIGGRRVVAQVEGKPTIEITPPPLFRGTDPSTWSPEDFFVAAVASCLAVTFTDLAARAGLPYTSLRVDADGVAGLRDDGHFGFRRLLLRLEIEVDPADEVQARDLAERAEATCLVSASLDLPIETLIEVTPPSTP